MINHLIGLLLALILKMFFLILHQEKVFFVTIVFRRNKCALGLYLRNLASSTI
jgi:hypothetical protein